MTTPQMQNQSAMLLAMFKAFKDGSLGARIAKGMLIAGLRNLHGLVSTPERAVSFIESAQAQQMISELGIGSSPDRLTAAMELLMDAPNIQREEWANRVISSGILDNLTGDLSSY